MEKGQPLCLSCADLDPLNFLPSGDATLTRRARRHSRLSAVIVRFVRTRKRYERQGILLAPEAIEEAEKECFDNAELREVGTGAKRCDGRSRTRNWLRPWPNR